MDNTFSLEDEETESEGREKIINLEEL